MKLFTTILMIAAFGLIVFNVTLLDFDNLFANDSLIALIGIIAAICALLILVIFRISKKIESKLK